MTTIKLTTRIEAPVELVFDLSRSIDLHIESAGSSGERAVGGVTTGLIGPDEEVVWSARHLGIRHGMTVRITGYDRPHSFQDRMIRGPFAHMEHDHVFEQEGTTTVLHDTLRFEAPLGCLGGRLIDRVILQPHLRNFLLERNRVLKQVAEFQEWIRFL